MERLDYFATQKLSIKSFGNFCRNNVPLVIAVSVALFLTHGVKLILFSIGIDTESFLIQKAASLLTILQIGRFGLAFLQSSLYGAGFNPVLGFAGAICFTWLFTLSWCYIIALFSRNMGKNDKLIPFALLFMTSPVWAEQFYFVFQATEIAAMIFICPYVIYFLFKGFLENRWINVIGAGAMLIFMISVYQAIAPLFICGVCVCLMLLMENSDYERNIYFRLCLKIVVTVAVAIALYFCLSTLMQQIPHIGKSAYLENMNRWGKQSVWQSLVKIIGFCYAISIGHIQFLQDIAKPMIENAAQGDLDAVLRLKNYTKIISNVLLLPGCVFFIFMIVKRMREEMTSGRILYLLAGISVPCSTILLAVAGGSPPPLRSLFVLPFALAFMLFFLIENTRKPLSTIIAALALLAAVYQGQITAQLYYSDYMRYQDDIQFARELDRALTAFQVPREFPVAIVGARRAASVFGANFFQGQVLGYSFFEWGAKSPHEGGGRGVPFMQALGLHYGTASLSQMNAARTIALSMPAYPAAGSVKRLPDMIVVKLSESTYQPKR